MDSYLISLVSEYITIDEPDTFKNYSVTSKKHYKAILEYQPVKVRIYQVFNGSFDIKTVVQFCCRYGNDYIMTYLLYHGFHDKKTMEEYHLNNSHPYVGSYDLFYEDYIDKNGYVPRFSSAMSYSWHNLSSEELDFYNKKNFKIIDITRAFWVKFFPDSHYSRIITNNFPL